MLIFFIKYLLVFGLSASGLYTSTSNYYNTPEGGVINLLLITISGTILSISFIKMYKRIIHARKNNIINGN